MTPIYINATGILTPAGCQLSDVTEQLLSPRRSYLDNYDGTLMGRLGSTENKLIEDLKRDRAWRGLDRAMAMGVVAAERCRQAAGGETDARTAYGVVFGSSRGATQKLESELTKFVQEKNIGVKTSPLTTSGSFASLVSKKLRCEGPAMFVSSACSTGLNAIVVAASLMRSGAAPGMYVGASEAALTPFTFRQLKNLKVYHSENSASATPQFPYQPFSDQRSGLVLGEGAGCLLLEATPSTRRVMNVELLGFASTCESGEATITGMSTDGKVLVNTIRQALQMSQVNAQEVDFVIAHGAGTRVGDLSEKNAYGQVFDGEPPPILSTKWLFGHMLGASGIVDVALARELLLGGGEPKIPYATILPQGRKIESNRVEKVAVIAGLGFGGTASAVVLASMSGNLRRGPSRRIP